MSVSKRFFARHSFERAVTIFMMFAAKTEASKLNLLKGSPHRWLTGPILDYIQQRGGKLHLRHRVKQVDYSEGETPEITGLQLGTPAK